jgi:hypothetical protein
MYSNIAVFTCPLLCPPPEHPVPFDQSNGIKGIDGLAVTLYRIISDYNFDFMGEYDVS